MATNDGGQEQREKDALDRALSFLAITSDERLASVLKSLLPKLLRGLESSEGAKEKIVSEVLPHVNKRLRANAQVRLPFAELVAIYLESPESFSANFAIVYIQWAAEREPVETIEGQVHCLLSSISRRPTSHRDILLRVASVGMKKWSRRDAHVPKEQLEFLKDEADRSAWRDFVKALLLFEAHQPDTPPPGLNLASARRIHWKSEQPSENELVAQKLGALNASQAFNMDPTDCLPLYIIASANPRETVHERGQELLRKRAAFDTQERKVDLSNEHLIHELMTLFLGSDHMGNEVPKEQRIAAPLPHLRSLIIQALSRSETAADMFPRTLDVVRVGTFGTTTNARLRANTMEFVAWVFKFASSERLREFAPTIMQLLTRVLDEGLSSVGTLSVGKNLRGHAYEAMAQLSSRVPEAVNGSIAIANRFFSALSEETQDVKTSVRESLATLASAYAQAPQGVLMELEAVLLSLMNSDDEAVRSSVCLWVQTVFPSDNALATYILIILAADTHNGVKEQAQQALVLDPNAPGGPSSRNAHFDDVLAVLAEKHQQLTREPTSSDEPPLPSEAFAVAISYLRRAAPSSCAFQSMAPQSFPTAFCTLCEHALSGRLETKAQREALKGILDVGQANGTGLGQHYAGNVDTFVRFLHHHDREVRSLAAEIVAIIVGSSSPDLIEKVLKEQLRVAASGNLRHEAREGALLCLGALLRTRNELNISQAKLSNVMGVLRGMLNTGDIKDDALVEPAIKAIGQAGLGGLVESGEEIVADLSSILETQVAEGRRKQAALSIGHLVEGDPRLADSSASKLVQHASVKNDDLSFSIGQALAAVGSVMTKDGVQNLILDSVVPLLNDTSEDKKRSGAIWARCLIDLPRFEQQKLDKRVASRLQKGLCIAAYGRRPISQEEAERGIARMKVVATEPDELAKELSEGLAGRSEGRLHEMHALARNGGNLSATYTLLALSSAKCGDVKALHSELQHSLPSLVPGLFRMCFDPDDRVREAAETIWLHLESNHQRKGDLARAHAGDILEQLLASCVHHHPRHRTGAALALARFIPGFQWPDVSLHFTKLWHIALTKLADDVSDSVRESAKALLGALRSFSTKLCDSGETSRKHSIAAASELVPLLIEDGLQSNAKESRQLASNLLPKILKLVPHGELSFAVLSSAIERLLESVSSLEDSRASFVEQHADSVGIGREQLSAMRASAARQSPILDAVEMCLSQVGEDGLDELVPRLEKLARSGTGLTTLTSTAHTIGMLCRRMSGDAMSAHAPRLVNALLRGLQAERSTVARQAFASALAQACRRMPKDKYASVVKGVVALVDDPGDEEACGRAAAIFREQATIIGDQLAEHSEEVVPVAFILRFEDEKWEDALGACSSSEPAALRMHASSMIGRAMKSDLTANRWSRKKSALEALRKAFEDHPEEQAVKQHASEVSKMLANAMGGRVFDGKEKMPWALCAAAKCCDDEDDISSQVRALSDGCRRAKGDFSEASASALGELLRDRANHNHLGMLVSNLDTQSPTVISALGHACSSAAIEEINEHGPDILNSLMERLTSDDSPKTAAKMNTLTAMISVIQRAKDLARGGGGISGDWCKLLTRCLEECRPLTRDMQSAQTRVCSVGVVEACVEALDNFVCEGATDSREGAQSLLNDMAKADPSSKVQARIRASWLHQKREE